MNKLALPWRKFRIEIFLSIRILFISNPKSLKNPNQIESKPITNRKEDSDPNESEPFQNRNESISFIQNVVLVEWLQVQIQSVSKTCSDKTRIHSYWKLGLKLFGMIEFQFESFARVVSISPKSEIS